jgi:5-methylcytosine-specific restriction endonuclease McrA
MQREQYQWHQAQHVYKVELDSDRERIKQFYLNCPDGMIVDHITPMSLGGSHTVDNLQYLNWQTSGTKARC